MSWVNRMVDWVGDSRWRAYLLCFVAASLPLAAFGYSVAEMLKLQVERRAEAESAQAASLLSAHVTDYFQQQTAYLQSFAQRRHLRESWLRRDLEGVRYHLQQASELQPEVSHFSLNEVDGTLRAVFPPDPEVVDKSFAFRAWYQAVSSDWQPHVSEVFPSVIGERKLVVVAAIPVHDDKGTVIGIFVARYPVDRLVAHFGHILGSGAASLTVVDQKGQVVMAAGMAPFGEPVSLADYPPALQASAGARGAGTFSRRGEEFIAAFAPIPNLGWGVVADQPLAAVRGQMKAAERQVGGFTIFFMLFAGLAGGTLASVYRNLRQATAQVSDLYDNAPCGYHSLDSSGVFVRINQAELDWLGYTRDEVVGKMRFLDVIDERSREVFRTNFPVLKEKGAVRELEFRMVRKNGSTFPVLLSSTAMRDAAGNYLMSRSTVFDISDRKQAEEALRKSERRQYALNLELEQRNREVQRATELKSKFLANMSHELRTPLNAILGFSELLELRVPGPLTEKQERYVQHIRQGGKHLLQLVNDVLDLSKIEAGHLQLRLEEFNPAAVVPEVLSVIRPLAMSKGIDVSCELDRASAISADRVRFKQVLYNLLSNAVKFTPERGTISIRASAENGCLAICVEDTGVGIRPEDQASVFEEFRQAGPATSGTTEGTGLGLAITRRIVEQHGGRITLESEPGRGSCFTFTLPLAPAHAAVAAPQPARAAPQSAEPQGRETLVLVVDDDPATCDLMAECLREEGYCVAKAFSGEEALRKAKELKPAAITLDILMPDRSGFSVLSELRRDPATQSIPVIVVSVVDQSHLGAALGAAEYLVKPVNRAQLLHAVEEHLGRAQEQPSLLVVDDDPEVLLFVSDTLEARGYTVYLAASGNEALRLLDSVAVQGVVLDLVMPGMDGFEVMRRLRERPALRHLPVFVLTAKEVTAEEMEMLRQEARDLLHKTGPWKHELLEQVRRHVGAGGPEAGAA